MPVRISMNRSYCKGFNLIESMVALLVISVGLLGVAALFLNSVKATDSAMLRSQAISLAYELADRARANYQQAELGAYNIQMGVQPAAVDCSASPCAADQLAISDLAEWKAHLAANLPSGDGSAVLNAGEILTITVQWDDRGTVEQYQLQVQL